MSHRGASRRLPAIASQLLECLALSVAEGESEGSPLRTGSCGDAVVGCDFVVLCLFCSFLCFVLCLFCSFLCVLMHLRIFLLFDWTSSLSIQYLIIKKIVIYPTIHLEIHSHGNGKTDPLSMPVRICKIYIYKKIIHIHK